jgi:hypothetical protein
MLAYTGAGASASVRARCRALGLRTLACPRDMPSLPTWRRVARKVAPWGGRGWAYDNGVFELWRHGARFEGAPETHWLNTIYDLAFALDELPDLAPPDWCVLPDVVGDGAASLRKSLDALDRLHDVGLRWALVTQDGMTPDTLPWDAPFDLLFVGGTLEWKLDTGRRWAEAAHEHGRRCHVGRVGTPGRVRWARFGGVDSIDSCLPLWSEAQFDRFAGALTEHEHGPLWQAR